jgi:hypothetical protein
MVEIGPILGEALDASRRLSLTCCSVDRLLDFHRERERERHERTKRRPTFYTPNFYCIFIFWKIK